jgi:hypothetical protein
LKNRLGDIETNCRDRLHVWLLRTVGALNSTHIHGTSVPVEEPSTASKADTLELIPIRPLSASTGHLAVPSELPGSNGRRLVIRVTTNKLLRPNQLVMRADDLTGCADDNPDGNYTRNERIKNRIACQDQK